MPIIWNAIYCVGIFHFFITLLQLFGGFLRLKKTVQSVTGHSGPQKSASVIIPVCDEDSSILRATVLKCKELEQCSQIIVIENSRIPGCKADNIALCDELRVDYISIANLGNKAKALNYYLRNYSSKSSYIAVLDVDQQPEKSFLSALLPFFDDEAGTALVQVPQQFRNASNNWISYLVSSMQAMYFEGIALTRSRLNFSTCLGTNFIFYRKHLETVGFFDEHSKIEDLATSLKLSLKGYTIKYVNWPLVTGLAPESLTSLFIQVKRYVIGCNQILAGLVRNFIFGNYRVSEWPTVANYLHCSSVFLISSLTFFSILTQGIKCRFILISLGFLLVFFFLLSFLIKPVRAITGIFCVFLLLPVFLLASSDLGAYNSQFRVTPKKENPV